MKILINILAFSSLVSLTACQGVDPLAGFSAEQDVVWSGIDPNDPRPELDVEALQLRAPPETAVTVVPEVPAVPAVPAVAPKVEPVPSPSLPPVALTR